MKKNNYIQALLVFGIFALGCALLSGCKEAELIEKKPTHDHSEKGSQISLAVQNDTGNTLYVSCFSYLKKHLFSRWQWYKTPVYSIEPQEIIHMPISSIHNERDRRDAFGVLALFQTQKEAEDAIYELLHDDQKIELDRLADRVNGIIKIGVESYGIVGNIFDYDYLPSEGKSQATVPELDFVVENKTGSALYVAGFIYQKKGNDDVWRYDKTPLVFIEDGESAVIDVDTITNPYDRAYMRGYLGIFEKTELEKAQAATFQLLDERNKVNIGVIAQLRHKKIILTEQKYGILGDNINYSIKSKHS